MHWQVLVSRIHCGGRIMIAVAQVNGKDKIIAGSIWNAPGKRVQFSIKEMIPLYQAGTLTVLRYWGFSGVRASPMLFSGCPVLMHLCPANDCLFSQGRGSL